MSQQPFPQQGYAPQQQQFPQQGYAPVQQPGGYGQPAQQGFPQQQGNPWGGQAAPQAPQQQAPAQRIETGESFDDFFSGGGEKIPGFDFGATQNGGEKLVGSMVMGEITEMARMQQRDYADPTKLLYFDDGAPRMQIAITLQTELRGWAGVKPKLIPVDVATGAPKTPDQDTGLRRVYVKGDMVRAINQACARAGQKPRVGGKLAVTIRGFEPTNKGNDKTLYDAQYLPAPEKVATDSFFDTNGGQPAQQAPVQQQAFQQAPPAQMPQQGFPGQQGQVHAANPYAGVPAQPNGAPEGFQPQQGQPQVAGYQIQPEAPAQQAPQAVPAQQFPSTLGNSQAPQGAPEWAQPQGQGYEPQASPAGYDKPPF